MSHHGQSEQPAQPDPVDRVRPLAGYNVLVRGRHGTMCSMHSQLVFDNAEQMQRVRVIWVNPQHTHVD